MTISIDLQTEDFNPLDRVEDVLATFNWSFDRMAEDEITLTLNGKYCTYRLIFLWQENMNALQLGVQYDLYIDDKNIDSALKTLGTLNAKTWIGHFEITPQTQAPYFRYTCLNASGANADTHIQTLIDTVLMQCEESYPVFHLLSTQDTIDNADLPLALMETQGAS